MKQILLLFLLLSAFYSARAQDLMPTQAHPFKKRVVLLFTPDLQQETFKDQLKQAQQAWPEYGNRDLIVVQVLQDKVYRYTPQQNETMGIPAQRLRTAYNIKPQEYRFMLLGSDGSVKMNTNTAVLNRHLFNYLDQAPKPAVP